MPRPHIVSYAPSAETGAETSYVLSGHYENDAAKAHAQSLLNAAVDCAPPPPGHGRIARR